METRGTIILLNGAPRSGKTSIAREIQGTFPEVWLNLGVDAFANGILPARLRPGFGLRPGGERPDLEPMVPQLYQGLFDAVSAFASTGLHVVVDLGMHHGYSTPYAPLVDASRRLQGYSVLFVGVRCPVEEIMRRRNEGPETNYVKGDIHEPPAPVIRWQEAVHAPGIYDLEVDTSALSPSECAVAIRERWEGDPTGSALMEAALLLEQSF